MHYFAGLFDAEGCISLSTKGAFTISLEMANEEIPNLFRDRFQGSIYTRKRDDRKKTWIWKINSISSQALFFLDSISNFSQIKFLQINSLLTYLEGNRAERKALREETIHELRAFKNPLDKTWEYILDDGPLPEEEGFYEWFAGFIDGDGNFVCNQYTDNRNSKKYFGHQISFSSIYPFCIEHINSRLPGTVTKCPRSKNLLYKWMAKRENEQLICESLLPLLRIKKNQCALFLEFITTDDVLRKYEIIRQVKHFNSL